MKQDILNKVETLINMYQKGELGGEVMPEDENPNLPNESNQNYLYFTLPMALNYQRNSYTLWKSANKTYQDETTRFVFEPKLCIQKPFEEVQTALTKYKLALQKQKQTEIWITLCNTIVELYDGDIRKIFETQNNDVNQIKNFIQKENKNKFPYLSGTKICNYWLYVIYQYTDRKYKNIEDLTVAPDTHVVKATHQLGLITDQEFNKSNVQRIVIDKWNQLLKDTKYKPIEIHTPLWLWSRGGLKPLENPFKQILETCQYVSKNAKHVTINDNKIEQFIKEIENKKIDHWLSSNPYGMLNLKIDDLIHFLIIFGSIDYSFWGEPKWTIETEKGPMDGAFAQIYTLMKLRNQKGHLDFEKITFKEFQKAYQGNVEIPLLKTRYETVTQISQIINQKMNGNFYQFIKNNKTDIELFKTITTYFPSFEDKRTYNGKTIYFYKLAQLVTSDILQIREQKEGIQTDYSNLVGCADYKIPQVLRELGILIYDEELSNIIDKKVEIKENSIYETEIRACMITAINKIKQKTNRTAIEINDLIWSFGQHKTKNWRPYHRTRTTSY